MHNLASALALRAPLANTSPSLLKQTVQLVSRFWIPLDTTLDYTNIEYKMADFPAMSENSYMFLIDNLLKAAPVDIRNGSGLKAPFHPAFRADQQTTVSSVRHQSPIHQIVQPNHSHDQTRTSPVNLTRLPPPSTSPGFRPTSVSPSPSETSSISGKHS